MSKQTFSASFSGKRHDNVLCICYQQRANVIMRLRPCNIIFAVSEINPPPCKSHLYVPTFSLTRYELPFFQQHLVLSMPFSFVDL